MSQHTMRASGKTDVRRNSGMGLLAGASVLGTQWGDQVSKASRRPERQALVERDSISARGLPQQNCRVDRRCPLPGR
jgi:hypothetical protein